MQYWSEHYDDGEDVTPYEAAHYESEHVHDTNYIHSSGENNDPYWVDYYGRTEAEAEAEKNWSMPSWFPSAETTKKYGGEGLAFLGGVVGKPVPTGAKPAAEGATPAAGAAADPATPSSGGTAQAVGEFVGGIFGTGGGASGSTSAMVGQLVGGLSG
jgi:hypothetical protein